jgi:hypothetical protein
MTNIIVENENVINVHNNEDCHFIFNVDGAQILIRNSNHNCFIGVDGNSNTVLGDIDTLAGSHNILYGKCRGQISPDNIVLPYYFFYARRMFLFGLIIVLISLIFG